MSDIEGKAAREAVSECGQRPSFKAFGVGCSAFSSHPKKVPPPTPDGREGRLFPPEHSWKSVVLVTDLIDSCNKILCENYRTNSHFVHSGGNPDGILSQSPGLQGTRYPGLRDAIPLGLPSP